MNKKKMVSVSKYISYLLRHDPKELKMDSQGWVSVPDLINHLQKQNETINFETIENIVNTDAKSRYSFNNDKTKIRANQGHSLQYVNIDFKELTQKDCPEVLYHGTSENNLDSIYENGLCKQSRQFVHLTDNIETAYKVGCRYGKPTILTINTHKMLKNGIKIYISENNVYLVDYIPKEYIQLGITLELRTEVTL